MQVGKEKEEIDYSDIDDAFVAQQLQPLKSRSDAYKRILDRKKQVVTDLDSKIAQNTAKLNNAKTFNKTSSLLDADIVAIQKAKADGTYAKRQSDLQIEYNNLTVKEKKLKQLENKLKRLEKQEVNAKNNTTREALRDQIKDARADIDIINTEIANHKTAIDEHNKWLLEHDDSRIPILQAERDAVKLLEDADADLRQQKAAWDKYKDDGHTDKYDDFMSRYPEDANGNITLKDPTTGREITRNLKEILRTSGIQFKQGGNINFNKLRKFQPGGKTTPGDDKKEDKKEDKAKFDWSNLNLDKFLLDFELPRALFTNYENTKINDLAKEGEVPFVQDPLEINYVVHGDLNSEMRGRQASGIINSRINNNLTSDANLNQAAQLEGAIKGQELINQGIDKSNSVYRDIRNKAEQQEKENAQNRHNTAMQNRLSFRQIAANKNKYDQALENKQHETWDTLLKKYQYILDAKEILIIKTVILLLILTKKYVIIFKE